VVVPARRRSRGSRKPSTLGELRSTGYKVVPVKQELRRNLISKMRKGEDMFPGIYGFEDTVLPQLQKRNPLRPRTSSSWVSAARRSLA